MQASGAEVARQPAAGISTHRGGFDRAATAAQKKSRAEPILL
jgi:hypothetical protein